MLSLIWQHAAEQHAEYLALADEALRESLESDDPEKREQAEKMHYFYMGALVASARYAERIRDAREEAAEQAAARGRRAGRRA
jgi:hypothetical protein